MRETDLVRALPQAIELEESVLGILLDQWNLLDEIIELLPTPETFYKPSNQLLYATILKLYKAGYPADLTSVVTELRKTGKLEQAGGMLYLLQIKSNVLSVEPILRHAVGIRDAAMRREQIRIADLLKKLAYDQSNDIFEVFETAEQELFNASQVTATKDTVHFESVTNDVIRNIYQVRAAENQLTGIASGFKEIDNKTNGWQRTDLIIIAARPSVGKTAFALNLAINAATDIFNAAPGAIFSLEMSVGQLAKRILSAMTGVPLESINKSTELTEYQIQKLITAKQRQKEISIHLDDTAALTIPQLRAKVRKLVKKHGIMWIIIDYLQLMGGDEKKNSNREQEISKISRSLKSIAKEFGIPVIAISQLNRLDNDVEPQLGNLRESGAIEQDADLVLFLYNPPANLVKEDSSYENKKMVSCAKHRNGSTFHEVLEFRKEIQLFEDVAAELPFGNGYQPARKSPTYEDKKAKKLDNSHLKEKPKLVYDPDTRTYHEPDTTDELPF